MNKVLKLASLVLALSSASAAFSAPITGKIFIGANDPTSVSVDYNTNMVTFNPVANANARVTLREGDYTTLNTNLNVNYFSFSYGPNTGVNTLGAVGPTKLWEITNGQPGTANAANTNFTLSAITLIDESSPNVFGLNGTGIAKLVGFDDTPGFWSFSANRTTGQTIFNWSSTNISPIPSVPDGGTTAVLLGMGLVAVGFIARRKNS